jgi:dihydrofolate reductase
MAGRPYVAPTFFAVVLGHPNSGKTTLCRQVIGGGELYAQALPQADELILTEVDADFDADTFFPAWDRSAFTEVSRETHQAEAGWPYHSVVYQRRK